MSRHVAIIGGGVVGLSTAHCCAQRGHRVTLIERYGEVRDGCSFQNAGLIVPSHFVPLAAPGMVALGLKWMLAPTSPFHIKPRLSWDLIDWCLKFWRAATREHVNRSAPLLRDLNMASRSCFEEIARLPGADFGLEKRGLLMLCKTDHALEEESRAAGKARELGMPAEILDARRTAELDPNVTMDIVGSVFYPKDCHLTPDRLLATLQRLVSNSGAELIWNESVVGWSQDGRGRLRAAKLTSGLEVTADEFVLAAGSWSPETIRELGLKLPIQAGKGYSVTLPTPRQLPGIPSIFVEARMAITPIGQSLRFGGTMEIAGLNENINPARVRGIINAVPRYYPKFKTGDFEGIEPWFGLRPCSPDGLPYVGRTSRYNNLLIATGHAMMGTSLAPITGKIISQLISGEKPEIDIALLSPDRYN